MLLLRHDGELRARPHRVAHDVDAAEAGRSRASGRTRVVSIPMVVVFPAPLGPSSPNTSPEDAAKDTPSTAFTGDFG